MGIQIDAIRSLEALRLVTFTLLIENVQLNSNIWITSRNSPAFSRRINKFNEKEEKQTRLLVLFISCGSNYSVSRFYGVGMYVKSGESCRCH